MLSGRDGPSSRSDSGVQPGTDGVRSPHRAPDRDTGIQRAGGPPGHMETEGSSTRTVLDTLKRRLLYLMGLGYVVAGVMHFVVPKLYVQIVPPSLPRPELLVYLSGVAEVALCLGVLSRRTRRVAAWGIVALLVAVFPANLYMATHDAVIEGAPEGIRDPSNAARWGRLPLQAVLLLWAWWYTRDPPDEAL